MSEFISILFNAQEHNKDFEQLDSLIQKTCQKEIQQFGEKLSPLECEQLSDLVYSMSYLSKKSAFEIGFKTAIRLILDCSDGS